MKMVLNQSESVKLSKNGKFAEKLSDCQTEEDLMKLRQEVLADLEKDAEIFVMSVDFEMSKAQEIMRTILTSDIVVPRDVYDFTIKNINDVNKTSVLEGLEEIKWTDNVQNNRALINFCYYGTQHHNNLKKVDRKSQLLKTEYYKVFSGETSIEDYLGLE